MKKIAFVMLMVLSMSLLCSCKSTEDKIKQEVVEHYDRLLDYAEKIVATNVEIVEVTEEKTIYNVNVFYEKAALKGIVVPYGTDCVEVTYHNKLKYIYVGGRCK